MTERIDPTKYIIHSSGLPIRIPPYLRRKNPDGFVQKEMIGNDPCIGNRTSEDTLLNNFDENVRLRRIAKKIITPRLVAYAEQWGVGRFAVVVHGSVAKGLVRNPSGEDRSDVDIDLVIDDPTISGATKKDVRESMRNTSDAIGVRVDSYVFTIKDLKLNKGEDARLYLRSAAYPTAEKGGLWEEILWIGRENQRFLNLPRNVKKDFMTLLVIIANGQVDQALEFIRENNMTTAAIHEYLESQGLLMRNESSRQNAIRLHSLVSASAQIPTRPKSIEESSGMWPPKLREPGSVYFA